MARQRDEAGVAVPTPVVMLSVVAVAMAGIALLATGGNDDTMETVSKDRSTTQTTEQTIAPTPSITPKVEPINRSKVLVEVFNLSNVTGLAGRVADKVDLKGWQVVGADNWTGYVPESTVYYGPRLKREGEQLAKDLGIERVKPAEPDSMNPDRLTVLLTGTYGS